MIDPKSPTRQLPSSEEQFIAARALLAKLIHLPDLRETFDPEDRPVNQMVYTNGLTIWMLILQRLGKGQSLSKVVSEVLSHQRDVLPDGKRVREHTLSENTSAYSKARQRIPLSTIEEFSHQICNYLGRNSPELIKGRRVFILDGTTITLPPTPSLKKAFPPANNQYGESVWPVAMLMVANELQSGCAILPQIDPMYGENNSSEAEQSKTIVCRLPQNSIVMADSGFGIFSVAYATRTAGHDLLFRLSHSRFKALRKNAELIDETDSSKSYRLTWMPSSKDRKTNPEIPENASVEVFIHEVQLENGKKLYLVTSLDFDASSAATLYCRRYDVEFDIRDLKVTMDTENIRAKSVDMVLKELMTSIVAYNLVAQFRRQAAQLARVEPRRLSFTGVWISFQDRLLRKQPSNATGWLQLYVQALVSASERKLPNRKSPRVYPRQAHPRRPKTTKFQKAQRRKTGPPPLE